MCKEWDRLIFIVCLESQPILPLRDPSLDYFPFACILDIPLSNSCFSSVNMSLPTPSCENRKSQGDTSPWPYFCSSPDFIISPSCTVRFIERVFCALSPFPHLLFPPRSTPIKLSPPFYEECSCLENMSSFLLKPVRTFQFLSYLTSWKH